MTEPAYEELMGHIQGRRSVRRFRAGQVPRDLVERLLSAASWAPSASNRQDWLFSVVQSPKLRKAMADAVRLKWERIVEANADLGMIGEVRSYSAAFADFGGAPTIIAVSALGESAVQRQLLGNDAAAVTGALTSAAMGAQNLMLAAHALGLGTCCLTGALAAREELGQLLQLGRRRQLVCLVALGYPAESPPPPLRRPVCEIARFYG